MNEQKFEITLLESRVLPSGARIVSMSLGEGSIGDNKYEMRLVDMNKMCVMSHQTGKSFLMEWTDVVGLAIAAGIDKESPPVPVCDRCGSDLACYHEGAHDVPNGPSSYHVKAGYVIRCTAAQSGECNSPDLTGLNDTAGEAWNHILNQEEGTEEDGS